MVCVNERLGFGQRSCAGSGSRELIERLQHLLQARNLRYPIVEQLCLGRCNEGIAMRISPGGPFFTEVRVTDLPRIVEALAGFQPVDED